MIFSNYNSLLCQFTTLLFLTISGCTQNINPNNIHHNSQNSDLEQCRLMFSNIKKTITDNHTQDAQASTIKNFPYLRNNRFLASFRQQTLSDLAFKQWINQMEAIALQSIQIEIHNLPPTIKSSMPTKQQIKNCSQQLKKQDFFQSKSRFSNISQLKTMTIDEEYQTWKRFFGAYWLTSWGMKLGIHQMHKTIKATYQVSLDKLTDNKRLIHYVPAEKIKKSSTTNIRKMIKNSYNNDLKIPQLSNSELSQLFENFAPIWAIDVKTNQDKIGNPQWIQGMQQAVIDIAHPNIFHYHSHTRFNHKNLLQLNYVIWFPSRPAESFIDILSGHLDGLIWRVTLDEDGSVLVYDTIHNCGCYHQYYPAKNMCLKPADGLLQEPPFAPQIAPTLNTSERILLRIAHTSHFIDRVTTSKNLKGHQVAYQLSDYNDLRSIKIQGSTKYKSLFQENGIIAGTQRGERWILWPMGIPGPGEMRQRGHHATAFLGKKHFDDIDLLERSFERCR